jgi:hypothetical protein
LTLSPECWKDCTLGSKEILLFFLNNILDIVTVIIVVLSPSCFVKTCFVISLFQISKV